MTTKTPTVYDVADRAGVSIATVSRVLRTPDTVRPVTRARVLDAVTALGYVPSGSARGLAERRTGVIGLYFPGFDAAEEAPTLDVLSTGATHPFTIVQDEVATQVTADEVSESMLFLDEVLRGAGVGGVETGFRPHGRCRNPEALELGVRSAWERSGGVPILVTENGIATADDTRRIAYTQGALEGLHRAISDGIEVRAYQHWSALDNYEWASGFAPTFGLIAFDHDTFARHPKPSLAWLGEVARRNGL